MSNRLSSNYLIALLLILSMGAIWFCVGIGFGGWQLPHTLDHTTLSIRLPRVLVALIVGSSLSAAGASLQALFDNPLADPSLIGTSGGAALGVILVLAFGLGGISISLAAFLGAFLVCLFILGVYKLLNTGLLGLLVLGFVISAFCAALVSLILFMSNDLVLRSATVWLSGSLAQAGFVSPYYALVVSLLGFVLLCWMGKRLDILMLGEETAVSMGICVHRTRLLTVVGVALMTGAAVSLSGVIGFLGMIVPNVMARSLGGSRRQLIALSAWLGAVFLLLVDSLARWVTYPVDLPVGIVIALIGSPFFLVLFLRPR